MALITIFGDTAPTLTQPNDTGEVNLGLAFYVITATGYEARGIRFYVPSGTVGLPADGHLGAIYASTGSPAAPTGSPLATCTFTAVAPAQWNEATLDSPVAITPGSVYWAVVYFPSGLYGVEDGKFTVAAVESVDDAALFAAATGEANPGNCAYRYGAAGSLPTEGTGQDWYGLDVILDDGAGDPGAEGDVEDSVGLTDTVTAARTGLPSVINATATATDTLAATDTATPALTVGAGTGQRTVTATMMGDRITFGSAIDGTRPQGPTFTNESAGALTLGVQFTALRSCRITGCRIYKAPLVAGTVPVTVWTSTGTKITETTVEWVSDDGGWQDITFPTPAQVTQGSDYMVSYFSPNGHFATTAWVYNSQTTIVYPFFVVDFQGGGVPSAYRINATAGFPTTRSGYTYWIDPIAEWDDPMPGYESGTDYFDQWTNGGSSFDFPVGVFFPDPEWLSDYMDAGVNTAIAVPINSTYVTAIKAAGIDAYGDVQLEDLSPALYAAEDPDFAERLKGYFLVDEPDLLDTAESGFRSPDLIRGWRNTVRNVDSTRPCILNLGKVPPYAQGFFYKPTGSTLLAASQYWRDWAALADILSCDFYNMTSDQDEGRFGIWTYPHLTRVMRALNDGRAPVWGYVESTSQVPNEPTTDQVYRASWAHLIAGAKGIVFFDHRFANGLVTQDFAALLHDPDMLAQVQALSALLQDLGAPLMGEDTGLVTAYTSSGTLATAKGGLAAGATIPMHYTTREAAGTKYLFAMSIRPGSTTATFTIPTAISETLTVIGESRTVSTDGAGVFTDDFDDGDYTVHLYSWT